MAAKPNTRNWNDVQTAIATVAIVTTLGMWELFAAPAKTEVVETQEQVVPPTEPPVAAAEPARMPHVKIMFTPAASLTTTVSQQPQVIQKKKKKNNSGGGGSPTQTHTS
jgi:hypothetical protein